ncbi:MAG: penicillin-binding transpeptidase domain-containing protein [Planctomycetota bacterium]|jgi:penicillin-binding protein 2
MSQQKLQGSMFHRRLTLLWSVAAVMTLLLAAQMTKLAVGEGPVRRAAAQRRLNLVTVLPTTRGRILDRHGRVLAVDRPSYDVAVSYDVITGAWALKQAVRQARSAHRETWAAMSPADRDEAIAGYVPHFETRIEELWEAIVAKGGIDRPELDRRLDAIKQQVQTTAAAVWDRQFQKEIQLGRAGDDVEGFRPRPIREQRDSHVVLPRVPNKVAFEFRRLAEQLPGLEVQDAQRRDYPWSTAEVTLDRSTLPRAVNSSQTVTIAVEGVADHILGSMRDEVWAADVQRRPFKNSSTGEIVDFGGYRIGDAVGFRGLERVFEDDLRGTRGMLRKRLDSGQIEREPHQPGADLHLTLDIALQAQVQAILSPQLGLATVQQWHAGWSSNGQARPTGLPHGTPLAGAAVVLDVRTAEILAMVAAPTLAMGRAAPWSCREGDFPLPNRPAEAMYPPGSIVKPLVLAAAVSEGVHGLDEPIVCVGHFLPNRQDVARCWIYRAPTFGTHGSLEAEEAIARSCNIYFYTLGDKLGMPRLSEWFRRFGLGRYLDVGLLYKMTWDGGRTALVGESAGDVPDEQDVSRLALAGELRFASLILGTGQGPVTWTPVQAANAYAAIARGGAVRDPTLIAHRGERLVPPRPELSLDETLVETILAGLRASVAEPYGTGHHISYPDGTREPIINAEGVTVWAKTGTAQATPRACDLNCDGKDDVHLDDPSHAWFVGLVGAGTEDAEPTIAIAVIVEYGGSGGRTAGPIANQIIRALQAEGYLTRPTS